MARKSSSGVRKDGNLVTSQPTMTMASPMQHSREGSLQSGFPSNFGVGAGAKGAKSAGKGTKGPKSRKAKKMMY